MNANPLAKIPLFAGLAPAELDALADRVKFNTYPKNVILIHEGDSNASLYALLSGTVKIYTCNADGREALLRILGPGDYFGELTLLDDQPRAASVMTLEPCRAAVLTREVFIEQLNRNSELALGLLKSLSGKVRWQNEVTKSLALDSVYERLCRLLHELAEPCDGHAVIEGVSQRELAERVYASREMITAIFRDLKTGGYIEADRKRIILRKPLPEKW